MLVKLTEQAVSTFYAPFGTDILINWNSRYCLSIIATRRKETHCSYLSPSLKGAFDGTHGKDNNDWLVRTFHSQQHWKYLTDRCIHYVSRQIVNRCVDAISIAECAR